MRVKICGVTRDSDARLACELGAWAVGLMFVPASPRAVDLDRAKRLRSAIGPDTLAIGVFADAGGDFVKKAVRDCRLDAVQLHGAESPQECAGAGAPAYKAVSFAEPADIRRLEPYSGRVAGFFLETVRRGPDGREKVGGAELRRRWLLAREASRYGTLLLAGELTAENVAEAIRTAQPTGVDVCGGVEAEPGKKDPAKLEAFFRAVRSVTI